MNLVELRAQVRAATEEFDAAMQFHEAWKPATYDAELHQRVGHSFAGNTFLVVQKALRREMLLALMRLWDDSSGAIQMRAIAKALSDKNIMEELAADRRARWGGPAVAGIDDIVNEVMEVLRKYAAGAMEIIRKYDQGGASHTTLKKLKGLRNERLAHHQIKPTPVEVRADATDDEIEAFYQDMSRLIGLLLHAVLQTAYDPQEGADVFRFYAKFFWAAVRGEKTEGHPNYRPPLTTAASH